MGNSGRQCAHSRLRRQLFRAKYVIDVVYVQSFPVSAARSIQLMAESCFAAYRG